MFLLPYLSLLTHMASSVFPVILPSFPLNLPGVPSGYYPRKTSSEATQKRLYLNSTFTPKFRQLVKKQTGKTTLCQLPFLMSPTDGKSHLLQASFLAFVVLLMSFLQEVLDWFLAALFLLPLSLPPPCVQRKLSYVTSCFSCFISS